MKITDMLKAEHAVFQDIFEHIETTAPRLKKLAEVKLLAVLMERVMDRHTKTEDDLFIGPLEHCFEQLGQNETFHAEHRQIDEALERVHKSRNLKDARKLLQSAINASRRHFDKEERIVFPMAERVMNTRTLSSLGAEWLRKRAAATR